MTIVVNDQPRDLPRRVRVGPDRHRVNEAAPETTPVHAPIQAIRPLFVILSQKLLLTALAVKIPFADRMLRELTLQPNKLAQRIAAAFEPVGVAQTGDIIAGAGQDAE